MKKSIFLFSYNPVPTPDYPRVEGSGLRTWYLAMTLKRLGVEDITIAIWKDFPQKINHVDGIKLLNFSDNPKLLKKLTKKSNIIILNASMSALTSTIIDSINTDALLIVDAISPTYIEYTVNSLNEDADNKLRKFYFLNTHHFNNALVKGDLLLVANENQKHLYTGVISALGAILGYEENRFIKIPAFVPKDKNTHNKEVSEKIKILWFGGLYPWYDIKELIGAFSNKKLKSKAQLTVVGGFNPFYPKEDKRFNGGYLQALKLAKELDLIKDNTVQFLDWVDFKERLEIFNKHDIAISINNPSSENIYSFRIGVSDLIGHGLPVITNGGDYLGEWLISKGVAFRVNSLGKKQLIKDLNRIIEDKISIQKARILLKEELFDEIHLDKYMEKLIAAINSYELPSRRKYESPYFQGLDNKIKRVNEKSQQKLSRRIKCPLTYR